jgi:hypothetical protein
MSPNPLAAMGINRLGDALVVGSPPGDIIPADEGQW